MNQYIINYVRPREREEDDDYPHRYDVFVIATSLADALENAPLYSAKDTDIVHSVTCGSLPPLSNMRFTSAVRSKLTYETKSIAAPAKGAKGE